MTTPNLKNALLVSLLASMMALSACEKDGPMERAGESVDEAVENTGDALDDAADNTEDAIDDAADDIEDATN